MGGGKKQTIGFKYFFGLHAVICQSGIDGISELRFDNRRAWSGLIQRGLIRIDRPGLFGGKKREGGVKGRIAVLDGRPTQGVDSYLSARQTGAVPAYRGVVSMVFRQFYFGNNPYPKPWRVKVINVFSTFGGWLPSLAPIGEQISFERVAVHIALDVSGSMAGTRLATAKSAINLFLDSLSGSLGVSVRVQPWSAMAGTAQQAFNATPAQIASLKSFVNGLTTGGGTNFEAGVLSAPAFFEAADEAALELEDEVVDEVPALEEAPEAGAVRRVVIFITDGEPFPVESAPPAAAVLAGIEGVEVYGFNIDLADTTYTALLDNTPLDGVPVISGSNAGALVAAISTGFQSSADINPAHILRHVLIAPGAGGDGDEAAIGDSFASAAAKLFVEGFGLSLHWESPSKRDEFKRLVEEHIDANVFFDAATGKWEIKLIRPDYSFGSLPVFDQSVIVEWIDLSRPQQVDLPNQITVVWTKRSDGEPASVTRTNVAAVQTVGRIIPETVERLGITRSSLASRVCYREMLQRTRPLIRGQFRAAWAPPDLRIGDAIRVEDLPGGMEDIVARVVEIEEGDARDASILIRFAEDIFGLDPEVATGLEVGDGDLDVPPDPDAALPADFYLAEEVPYYELVRDLGQSQVDARLEADEGFGAWQAGCSQPSEIHVAATVVQRDPPSGLWVEVAESSMFRGWRLLAPLSAEADAVTFTALATGEEDILGVNARLLIGSELVRLDEVAISDGVATFTVGRAVLDTVPARHGRGSMAWLVTDRFGTDDLPYTEGDELEFRVLPRTGSNRLSVGLAPSRFVDFASRAARPYPVGRLQVEGAFDPGIVAGDVDVTWAHRDRRFQTTDVPEDHLASDIGPEPGVSYRVRRGVVRSHADLFAPADFFARRDFFLEDDLAWSEEFVPSPADGNAAVVSADPVDFFARADVFGVDDWFEGSFGRRAARLKIEVVTERGSPALENWQTPSLLLRPLLRPFALSLEEI